MLTELTGLPIMLYRKSQISVTPVAPVDTTLMVISATKYLAQISPNIDRSLRLESGHEDKARTSP